jgi:DNA-binding response OmpR family regulator
MHEQRSGSSLDGQYVLCIDNQTDILDGMRGLLSKWGARPLIASTQEGALAELEQLKSTHGAMPAILLVDYHLDDGVTGTDVILALRKASGVRLPAVILTADYTEEVIDEVRRENHAILHKPVKPAALRALMNRILSRRQVA